MSPRAQTLLGWLVGIVIFLLACGFMLLVSTLVVEPLPFDDTGKAIISLGLLAFSPLLAAWAGWLVVRTLRARLVRARG